MSKNYEVSERHNPFSSLDDPVQSNQASGGIWLPWLPGSYPPFFCIYSTLTFLWETIPPWHSEHAFHMLLSPYPLWAQVRQASRIISRMCTWFNKKPNRTTLRALVQTPGHRLSCQHKGRGCLKTAPTYRKAAWKDAKTGACRHCVSHRTSTVRTQNISGLSSSTPQSILCCKWLGLCLHSFATESGLSGTVRVESSCPPCTFWKPTERLVITKAAFTVSKGPDQQTTSMQTLEEAHLSSPNCSGNVGIPENDRSHLRLSYLTRAETSGVKTVSLSQSVFQISVLDLLPPKTSIPQASKGKQRKKAKGI